VGLVPPLHHYYEGAPTSALERADLPSSRVPPVAARPALRLRRRRLNMPVYAKPILPTLTEKGEAIESTYFEAQSRGPLPRCVHFTQAVTRISATLAFRLLALYRRDWLPSGHYRRFQCSSYIFSSYELLGVPQLGLQIV
jgi:hypothetical protein